MPVTLILTRNPLKEFSRQYWKGGKKVTQSGRWGELIAVKGPKITGVTLQQAAVPANGNGASSGSTIQINTGVLSLNIESGTVEQVKRYTSMERFKADSGKGYYVQLHPKKEPYWITYETGNSAVAKLRADGRCFRVHGGKPGPEQGILIHEAPHVGWVIGCIAPRPLNDFTVEGNENPSHQSMVELFEFVGTKRSPFFVLDW